MKKTPPPCFALRSVGLPVLIFCALTVYDVIIGGSLAALLKSDGFTALDQRINNVHQLAFGLVVAGALAWFYSRVREVRPVLALAILFAGFVEDTLFYLVIPFFNPLIEIITGGAVYQVAGGEFMPQQVSGWMGWVWRMATDQNAALPRDQILWINALAIALAVGLLALGARMRCSRSPGGNGMPGAAAQRGF